MTSISDLIETLNPDHPLLIVDADEVLLRFAEHLEDYFTDEGYELRLDSFQITGNVYEQTSGRVASAETVKELIGSFFDKRVESVPPVTGAAEALSALAPKYQIAVLTNVPHHCRDRREQALKELGFDYPVLSNAGAKGPPIKELSAATSAMTAFVDDLPPHHTSVAEHAPDVHRIHFVADPRLAALIGKAPDAHTRIDTWCELEPYLRSLVR